MSRLSAHPAAVISTNAAFLMVCLLVFVAVLLLLLCPPPTPLHRRGIGRANVPCFVP